ncbi:MAG: DUF3106 domain-containing protein [Pseudomonadota bacterium]
MTQYSPGHDAPAGPACDATRLAIIALLALGACGAWAQAPQGASAPAKAASAARPAAKVTTPSLSSPAWHELTPAQQQALKPLQANWATLTTAHKRKWIALSQTYPSMPAPEQARLHSRMTEWAALSPRQRAEARLNFAESQQHSPDEKKAKWQAYQALSPEEKQKLAAGAKPKPQGAAPAVKPVPAQKLAVVPGATGKPGQKQHPAIAGASGKLDQNTLLPNPVPPGAATQSN